MIKKPTKRGDIGRDTILKLILVLAAFFALLVAYAAYSGKTFELGKGFLDNLFEWF